ncbi:MAG TPA: hypothetical protein VH703_01435 [Solirubrobacterales bacterium]
MLERSSRSLAVGMVVLAMVVVGLAVGRAWLRDARRDVVVELEVTEDREQLFVNCVFVGAVSPEGEASQSFDLGWLRPDDRISIALVNLSQPVANVFYRGIVNGDREFAFKKGSLAAPGISVHSRRRYVFERTYSADGDLIGGAGCQRSRFVVREVEYMRLIGDTRPARSGRASGGLRPASFEPDRSMNALDTAGHVGPWALAVIGIVLMTPLVLRELFWVEGWDWKDAIPLGIGVIGVLLTLLGLISPLLAIAAVGLILYLIALMVLWNLRGRRGVRSAAESAGSGSR